MAKSNFPYATTPGALERFMQEMPDYGVPTRIDEKWLGSHGYTQSNDKRILGVLRFVGLLDAEGAPTEIWRLSRGNRGAVIASAVRRAYQQLYDTFPDAHQKDDEALLNFFRANTDLGTKALSFSVRTFRALAQHGDFEADPVDLPEVETEATSTAPRSRPTPRRQRTAATQAPPAATSTKASDARSDETKPAVRDRSATGGVTLNVSIQLQLPANADGETYDKLFASMGKHLRGLADGA